MQPSLRVFSVSFLIAAASLTLSIGAEAAGPKSSTHSKDSAVTEPAQPAETPAEGTKPPAEQEEKEAKSAVYLSGDLGFTRADFGAFSDSTGLDRTGANGVLYSLGAGYRTHELRFGARFRSYDTTEFSLLSIMAEAGYGLPIRPLSPIFMVHAGYMFDSGVERGAMSSSLPPGTVLEPNVQLRGLVLGVEANASYWVTKFLRVGPFLGFDLLMLDRAQADLPRSIFTIPPETREKALFKDSGFGMGYAMSLGIRVTTDIGL